MNKANVEPYDLLKGEVISKVIYAEVTEPLTWRSEEVGCKDLDTRQDFNIRGLGLIRQFVSASQYTKVKEVARTELAQQFVSVGARPFTVCFTKANQELRELVGRLVEHEDLMGRSAVLDLQVKEGSPLRQVDHRSLQWLIVNGVKYVLKS